MTQSCATTPGQSGPGSDSNKSHFTFLEAPAFLEPHHMIIECNIHDARWRRGGAYNSAEMQSVYSTAPADWDGQRMKEPKWLCVETSSPKWLSSLGMNSVIRVQVLYKTVPVSLFANSVKKKVSFPLQRGVNSSTD